MRLFSKVGSGLIVTISLLALMAHRAEARDGASVLAIGPEVSALLKLSTEAYHRLKSYQHTASYAVDLKTEEGQKHEERRFLLALDRPNRFCYKCVTLPAGAAVSDGTTFINFRGGDVNQFTKQSAPADYKGINIVDDVLFEPLGTYLVALMLQGDPLADKDVRSAMVHAKLKATVTENGVKWRVIEVPFGQEGPTEIYIGLQDHLIGKTVMKMDAQGLRVTETLESIRTDKPVESAVFKFSPPEGAREVEHIVPPQRPDTVRRTNPSPFRLALARR